MYHDLPTPSTSTTEAAAGKSLATLTYGCLLIAKDPILQKLPTIKTVWSPASCYTRYMTPAEEAFRQAKIEQYNQMRHGLYRQIVGWSHSLVKQIEQQQKKLPMGQRKPAPNAQAIINTVIAYIHNTRDRNPSGWFSAVKRTVKLP